MVRRIQGITIELDGDTTGLTQALSDVDSASRRTTGELREVDRALRLNPGSVELLAQQQQLLAEQVTTTTTRLNTLRQAQAQVQAQFDNGDIGAEQYRAFNRELATTESALASYQSRITESTQNQERLAASTRDLQTFFQATGTEIGQFTDVIGSRLSSAINNGTASADQINQALLRISRSALGTSVDINELQSTLRQIDSTGIEQVMLDLNRLGQSADDAEGEVKGLSSELGGIAGAVGGAVAGLSVLENVFEDASNAATIKFRLDLDEESLEGAEEAVRQVTAVIGDNDEALQAVSRQFTLFGDAGVEANQQILRQASAISRAYEDIDLNELIQETSEISRIFDATQEEALGLTNQLLKLGFPPDQLDIIAEYGNQLQRLGFDAEEAFGLIAAATQTDTFNIDNLLDGVKEARIVLAEEGNGISKEFLDAIYVLEERFGVTGLEIQRIAESIADGGETSTEALTTIVGYLDQLEGREREALGNAIFGR